ncbi:MAG: hypothetical protein HY301_07490 [Verrucomicrobia bacterium]|nr:hypothetical protein [Verrucomicrobiota bacterium]
MDPEDRASAGSRAKDPAWKPSTTEADSIKVGDTKSRGALKNFCLNAEGNILACFGASVRVYSPEGALLKTLPLEIKPTAIAMAKDGAFFVAGGGRLLKLDAAGKVLASAASPTANEPVVITKEMEEMIKEMATQSKKPVKDETARMKESLERRRGDVTGLAATDQDVFMAVGAPCDFTYRVYRFDHALANPKLVVEKLRGCCGQMDIQARDEKLWIPHNARHSIESRDRDGKELAKFGTKGKVKATDFGGCCEPKNMRVLANGDILAAESGPPTCIKRFSADGKFKEVIAVLDTKGDCVRVTVEVSPDGSRYYLLDTEHDAIRVFKVKGG